MFLRLFVVLRTHAGLMMSELVRNSYSPCLVHTAHSSSIPGDVKSICTAVTRSIIVCALHASGESEAAEDPRYLRTVVCMYDKFNHVVTINRMFALWRATAETTFLSFWLLHSKRPGACHSFLPAQEYRKPALATTHHQVELTGPRAFD